MYCYIAASVEGFVQQLAVGYVTNGYYFYVMGQIPAEKDPLKTDQRIIEKYEIDISKWRRVRRKKVGEANVQYLRYGHSFVILATAGVHRFFDDEATQIKDIREHPIRFYDYAISCHKSWGKGTTHPSVRIDTERYLKLKKHFVEISVHRKVEQMTAAFQAFPFEPYAPVRNQLYMILRAVNRKRKVAGLEEIPKTALRLLRKTTKPFAKDEEEERVDRHSVEPVIGEQFN